MRNPIWGSSIADWKSEKHVPVIEIQKSSENVVEVKVTVGKEIPHPNTIEHHIEWIELYFLPEGESFPYQLGRFEFRSHGASTQGLSGVYSHSDLLLHDHKTWNYLPATATFTVSGAILSIYPSRLLGL